MAKLTGYKLSLISYYKKQYAEIHEEVTIKNSKEKGVKFKETAFALLDEKPTLTLKELAQLTNCNLDAALKYRQQYAKIHEEIIIKNTRTMGPKIQENIFNLLDKNPSLGGRRLAKSASCSEGAAKKYKQRWLQLHSAEPQDEASAD